MNDFELDAFAEASGHISAKDKPLVVRVSHHDFQREVLEKLARLEAKMDMLVGGAQPGRMRLAEIRLTALEKNDIRRSVYDRLLSAAVSALVSAAIAMHDHIGLR